MTKYLLLFLILFSGTCYAVQDEPSLAEVLEWKYGPVAGTAQADQNDHSVSPKMVITSWNSSQPIPTDSELVTIFQDYKKSIKYLEKRVKKGDISEKLYQLSTNTLAFEPYIPVLAGYTEHNQFAKVKYVIEKLEFLSIITSQEATDLKKIYKDAKIDLDNLPLT